jgi:2-oxo-4-hydroxy-4-carboxy-5-ureidoimidazoline decarboxylase
VTIGPPGNGRQRDRPAVLSVDKFNALDTEAASEVLRACLDIPEWVAAVAAARPYARAADVYAVAAAAAERITWPQVAGALDRHPRIGERQAAASGTATETAWSSDEQAGVAEGHAQALARGNADYEQRFGHLFLICASGLSGEEILAALQGRLGHEPAVERDVVTAELRKIAALRLAKAVAA